MNANNEMELEVFRVGDYGLKGQWSADDLDQIARDYEVGLHEAPVTLDHAQEGPALGWVKGIRRCGDRLIARLKDVNHGLLDLMRQGAFRKRSVEIYNCLADTGRPYLKAVSFLGAAAPEVKGLSDVLLSEGADQAILFACELGESSKFDFAEASQEQRNEIQPEQESAADLQRHFTGEAEKEFRSMRQGLMKEGKWSPFWDRQGIEEFFASLGAVDEVAVSPEQAMKPSVWFAQFLASLSAVLPVGEAAPAPSKAFRESLPEGGSLAPESIDLHRRVITFQQNNPGVAYRDAMNHCARQA